MVDLRCKHSSACRQSAALWRAKGNAARLRSVPAKPSLHDYQHGLFTATIDLMHIRKQAKVPRALDFTDEMMRILLSDCLSYIHTLM